MADYRWVMAMRLLALLLFLVAGSAIAAVYKHVDENGTIRYTDQPPSKNAKPLDLPPVQTIGSDAVASEADTSKEEEESPGATPARAGYTRVELTSPSADQVFNNANPQVLASITIEPDLQPGDRVIFLVDGLPFAAPAGQTSTELSGLERGSHSVQAVVVNASNAIQAETDAASFHLHQPSSAKPEFDPGGGSLQMPSLPRRTGP